MTTKKVITIFGSSMIRPGDEDYEKAERLGQTLAKQGYTICNGGYMGSMEASAKGAHEAGGDVIGITTDALSWRPPCPYITDEQCQPTLINRIEKLIDLADAYIVLGGGIGTLAELFVVWNLLAIKSIPERPVLLFGSGYQSLLDALSKWAEIGPEQIKFLKVVESEKEILDELNKLP